MKAKFFGMAKNGKLSLYDPVKFRGQVLLLEGEIEITIGKRKKGRSNNQNSYYWAVVVEILSKELGYTPDEIHEALKMKFLVKHTGKIPTYVSTTKLSTVKMEEYLTKVREWASSFLGCYIPLPGEVDFF